MELMIPRMGSGSHITRPSILAPKSSPVSQPGERKKLTCTKGALPFFHPSGAILRDILPPLWSYSERCSPTPLELLLEMFFHPSGAIVEDVNLPSSHPTSWSVCKVHLPTLCILKQFNFAHTQSPDISTSWPNWEPHWLVDTTHNGH